MFLKIYANSVAGNFSNQSFEKIACQSSALMCQKRFPFLDVCHLCNTVGVVVLLF